MTNKTIYTLFLCTILLRVCFAALSWDTPLIHWYILKTDQTATFQWAFWRLTMFIIELFFMIAIINVLTELDSHKKEHALKMTKIMLWIQCWYIIEYCTHYTSVWITWEQLGLLGDGRSGLSSHIGTMAAFAYWGYD